jgi:phage host-nuclease inhibitor protein Gam
MTDQLTPLPALSFGEEEPVSDAALDWLGDRMGDEPEWSVDQAIASAAVDAEDPRLPDEGLAVLARWEIDGVGSAEWAMRKLAAAEAEGDEVAGQADEWIREIERWREARLRPLVARSTFFTEHLTRYLRRLRDEDPSKKSLPLPSGTVKSRTVPPAVEVTDEEAVEAWARNAGRADVLKTTVRLSDFKKAVTVDAEAGVVRDPDTGQPVAGAVVREGGVSYSVKVGS